MRAGRSRRTGKPPTERSTACRFTNAVEAATSLSAPEKVELKSTVPDTASTSAPAVSASGCTSSWFTTAMPRKA